MAIINPYAFSRAADTIAGKHGLSVRFGDVNGVVVGGKSITLPRVTGGTTTRDLDRTLAKVDYFGSLHRYADKQQKTNLKELPPDQPIGYMYRLFNDARITRQAASEFLGSRALASGDTAEFMDTLDWGSLEPRQQAVIAAALESENDWNTGATMVDDRLSAEGRVMLDKLRAASIPDMARVLKNGDDPLAIAKEAYRLLWEDDPDEQEQKERGEGEGEGAEGESGGEGESPPPPKVDPKFSPHAPADSIEGDSDERGEIPCRPEVEHGGTEYRLETDIEYVSMRNHRLKARPEGGPMEHMAKYYGSDGDGAANAVFANRIRRHIQTMAASDWEHGQKRGKLSAKNLWRLGMPRELMGPATERQFKRRIDSDVLDTAVHVMIDMSGSMVGDSTWHTYKATALLAHAMQVLNVPLEICMFTNHKGGRGMSPKGRDRTHIYQVKRYEEKINDDVLKERYNLVYEDGMANNNDATGLLWAYDSLRKRTEKRKILIMQSDGSPAAGGLSGLVISAHAALKATAARIEREGCVDLLAVGIGYGGEDCKEYYRNHVVIKEVSQLETGLFNLISKRMTS